MVDKVDDVGKIKGLQCQTCSVTQLFDSGTCRFCRRESEIMLELGPDQRCTVCWKEHLAHYYDNYGRPAEHVMISIEYACAFCKAPTLWLINKYLGYCTRCEAAGTMRMQICRQCHQKNFIFQNRGEVCADCIDSVPQESDFSEADLFEM